MDSVDIIDQMLAELRINQSNFLRECGIARSSFTDIRSGRIKKISMTLASKIVHRYPQFNIKWITSGEGEMYVSGVSAPVFQNTGNNVNNQQNAIDAELIGLLKEKDKQIGVRDEQINRLLTIIERMQS